MHKWLLISQPSDFMQLGGLPERFNPEYLIADLQSGLRNVKAILVEEDYVDKDYRSTYYNFYSKQGARYERECFRLHFFAKDLKYVSTAKGFQASDEDVQKHYLGFMVLRPIRVHASTIGRTVLSPHATRLAGGEMLNSSYVVHMLGYKLMIDGFPWMNQHTDISVCAHTACWSILRHYSNRYRKYAEFLTHDVTRMAHTHDPGGLFPSEGLAVEDAELVFRNAGTFPLTIARDVTEPSETDPFFRQVHAYLESGFPIYANMHSQTHAIALMGQQTLASPKENKSVLFGWDFVLTFLAVDDNHLPYVEVGNSATFPPVAYSIDDIDTVVVPLPDKIFFPADAVQVLAESMAQDLDEFAFPRPDDLIIRYFITTSAALKRFIRDNISEFDLLLTESIMSLPMAQFVWIVEYSTKAQWAAGEVSVRAILDASAGLWDTTPAWSIFDKNVAWFFNRNDPVLSTGKLALQPTAMPYTEMTTNLHSF